MSEPDPIVHVIEPNEAMRESIYWAIQPDGFSVQTHHNSRGFRERSDGELTVGCVVIGLQDRPGSELDLIHGLRDTSLAVVGIVAGGEVSAAVDAMKAGAFDVLEHPTGDETLLERVRDAIRRSAQRRKRRVEVNTVVQRHLSLTPREKQVMKRVVDGMLNKEIAADLGLSSKTVEVHRAHMMSKMETRSLASLVRMSILIDGNDGLLTD